MRIHADGPGEQGKVAEVFCAAKIKNHGLPIQPEKQVCRMEIQMEDLFGMHFLEQSKKSVGVSSQCFFRDEAGSGAQVLCKGSPTLPLENHGRHIFFPNEFTQPWKSCHPE